MGYTFRTDGPWGPGISEDLTPEQVDENFWQAIQDNLEKAAQGVGISNMVVIGNQLTVVLTDHTLLGPYDLPMMQIKFGGEWSPNTYFEAGTIITHTGSTYMVQVNHTSATTFDPYANDGLGNDYYGLLLQNADSALPAGGPAGWFLRKATSADWSLHWATAALTDLTDVAVSAPATGQVLTYESGHWQNLSLPTRSLEQLSDVVISGGVTTGRVLTYESGVWMDEPIPVQALAELTDTAIVSPQAGQPLVWNGSKWADVSTVDMPCGGLDSVQGSIILDRKTGEIQRLNLIGTVTDSTITGWPPGGQFARLVLEIQNTGAYGFAWPAGVLWPSGTVPGITANGKDLFILISFDGGTTVYCNVVGQDFK